MICSKCNIDKPESGFYPHGNQCKTCRDAYKKGWNHANKVKCSDYCRKTRYVISADEYEGLLKTQNNTCIVCNETFSSSVNVDHDHATGDIRGLICHPCNVAVGYYEKLFINSDLGSRIRRYLDG